MGPRQGREEGWDVGAPTCALCCVVLRCAQVVHLDVIPSSVLQERNDAVAVGVGGEGRPSVRRCEPRRRRGRRSGHGGPRSLLALSRSPRALGSPCVT